MHNFPVKLEVEIRGDCVAFFEQSLLKAADRLKVGLLSTPGGKMQLRADSGGLFDVAAGLCACRFERFFLRLLRLCAAPV
jgi:hypothetical protein